MEERVGNDDSISNTLKSGYQRQDKFMAFGFDDDRALSIAQHHVELSLIPKSRTVSVSQSDKLTQRTLFTPLHGERGPIRRILIIGEPGIGKSILCHKLAYDWSRGEHAERFQYVFWLTLRNLGKTTATTLAEWILEECFSTVEHRPSVTAIEKILAESKNECLILLDGIDEAREIYRAHGSPKGKLLRNIFSQFSNIVVTSRAHQVPDEIVESMERQIEIKGFSEEKIDEYISKQFEGAKDEEKEFRAFLQSKPAVQQILKIPLNLFLLCDLWRLKNTEKARETFRRNSTMTGLYEAFCLAFLRKRFNEMFDASQLSDFEQKFPKLFKVLERIAYDYLSQPGQVLLMSGAEIREICRVESLEIEDLRKSGLLKADRETGAFEHATYTFLHKTFQEYFAARYVLRCLLSQDPVAIERVSRFIEAEKYNPAYLVMTCFVSGLLSKRVVPAASQAFYDALLTTRIDYLGLKHIVLMIYILEHWDAKFFVTAKKHQKILEEIFDWLEASVRMPSTSEFQKVIQHQLGDALRVCPKMANICIERLAARWNEVNKKAALTCYVVPTANALNENNKRFFITVLEEQSGNEAFYQEIFSVVSWKPFRYFSDKERLFAVLEGLLLSNDRLVCASAAYAMAEICDADQMERREQQFRAALLQNEADKSRQLAFYNALVPFERIYLLSVIQYIFEILDSILKDREDKNQGIKLVLYVIRKNMDLLVGVKPRILEKLTRLLEMSLWGTEVEQEVIFLMQLLDKNSEVVKALTWKLANASGSDFSGEASKRKVNYFDGLRNTSLLKIVEKEKSNEKKIFVVAALLDVGIQIQVRGGVETVVALTRLVLHNKDISIRAPLASALVSIAKKIPDVIPVLREGVENREQHVKQFSALVLGQLGQSPYLVRPVLVRSLDSPLDMIGLEELSDFDEKIIYAVIMLLQSDSSEMRSAATQTLIKMGHSKPEVVLPIILEIFETGMLPADVSPVLLGGLLGLAVAGPVGGIAGLGLGGLGYLIGGKSKESRIVKVDKSIWREILEQLFDVLPTVEGCLRKLKPDSDSDVKKFKENAVVLLQHDELEKRAVIELKKVNSNKLARAILDIWNDEWRKSQAVEEHYKGKFFEFFILSGLMVRPNSEWKDRIECLFRLGWALPQIGWGFVRSIGKKPAVQKTEKMAMDLVQEGYASQEFVSLLIQILELRTFGAKMVMRSFSEADHVTSEMIDALTKTVKVKYQELSQYAAFALVKMGSKLPRAISILVDILLDENETQEVRQSVAVALSRLKSVHPEVVDGLNKTAESPYRGLGLASAISLIQLEQDVSDVMLFKLIDALGDPFLRKIAVIAFGKLKRLPDDACVRINNAFKSANPEQRRCLVMAAGNLQYAPSTIISMLMVAIKDECFAVRHAAIMALAELASKSAEVIDVLLHSLKNSPAERPILLEIMAQLKQDIHVPFSLYKTIILGVEQSSDPVLVCVYARALAKIKKVSFEKEESFSAENLLGIIERLQQDDVAIEVAILNKFYTENPRELIFNLILLHEKHEAHRKSILLIFKLLDRWGLTFSEMVDGYHHYMRQANPVNTAVLMPLAELVLRRGMLVTERLTDQECEMLLSDESGTASFQLTSQQYPVVFSAFLYAMQERLAELGLFSIGFQQFVELQKTRYAQSRQHSGTCFFQPHAVKVMGLVPYLTVNHSKWLAKQESLNDEDAKQSVGEYLMPSYSWKVYEQSKVLQVVPDRQAIKINLHNKKDARKRISELHQALEFISDKDELACCRYLDLSDNDLDNTDLVVVCEALAVKTVHCLVLSGNQITTEGLLALLDSLQGLKCSVKYLMLDRNCIWLDKRQSELINRALKKIGIVHVELSLNCISDVEIRGSSDFRAFQEERKRWLSDSTLWRLNYRIADREFKSIINPELKVEKGYGVVAVIKSSSALHWKLAIEYIDNFSQRIFILADLVVDNIDNKKVIDIRFYFNSPKEFRDAKYVVDKFGTLPRAIITQPEVGVLAEIFKSQELKGFQEYGLGCEVKGVIDCIGWIKSILDKKFGIPVVISRTNAAFAAVAKWSSQSPSSRK